MLLFIIFQDAGISVLTPVTFFIIVSWLLKFYSQKRVNKHILLLYFFDWSDRDILK